MGLIDWNLVWNNEMLVTDRARLNSGALCDQTLANGEGLGAFGENLTELEAMHDDVASVATDDRSGGTWIRRNEETAVVRWRTR